MAEKPRYHIARNDIPIRNVKPVGFLSAEADAKDITLHTQKVYGSDTSIMFAERASGYHTLPHQHDCEQFNIIVSGEIWFYVEEHGYLCKPGDIMRIPRNKVHWAWNRGAEKAVVIESHCPSLTGDAMARKDAVALLGPDDDAAAIRHVSNVAAPYDEAKVATVEERALAEEQSKRNAA